MNEKINSCAIRSVSKLKQINRITEKWKTLGKQYKNQFMSNRVHISHILSSYKNKKTKRST